MSRRKGEEVDFGTTLKRYLSSLPADDGDRFQTTSSGDGRGFSLMFEMNTLFEEYIGRTLRRVLVGTGLDVRLQGPQDHALIDDDFTPESKRRLNQQYPPKAAVRKGFALTLRNARPIDSTANSRIWICYTFVRT
jgi:hypothetical protein